MLIWLVEIIENFTTKEQNDFEYLNIYITKFIFYFQIYIYIGGSVVLL